jgi:hypothetical protein
MSILLIFGSLCSLNLSRQLFFVAKYFIGNYKIQNNLKKFTSPNTLVGRERDIISDGLTILASIIGESCSYFSMIDCAILF